jgi:peptidoglycan/xylan/chitin deacetylase (PgdA/CDA1 family)
MHRLKCLGYTTLPFSELATRLTSGGHVPERTIALTFDDGYADFYVNALPVLQHHDFTATLFVTTGWLDDAGAFAAGCPLDRMLTSAQVRRIADAGIEIGAHSHSHAELDQLPAAQLERELADSKALLEDVTGRAVRTLAYPYGYSNRRVRAAVAANGYRYAAAVANRAARSPLDPMASPRLTIRRSTDMSAFERIARTDGLGRAFLRDRLLTGGYSVVRHGRHLARQARGRG